MHTYTYTTLADMIKTDKIIRNDPIFLTAPTVLEFLILIV